MSTDTTLAHRSASLGPNLNQDSSHSPKHGNYAQRSISDHTLPTRTSSSPHLPNKSWHQSYSSFQTLTRSQCPHVHYHPWCEDCQTLTTWGQPLPIKPTYKLSIPTFGNLKTVIQEKSCYRSPSKSQSTSQVAIQKVCSTWREEQFAKAVAKRTATLAVREALCWLVHQQCTDRGAARRAK